LTNTDDAMNIEIDFDRAEYLLGIISSLVGVIDERGLRRPDLVRLFSLAPGVLRVELWTDQSAYTNAFHESSSESRHFLSYLDHIVTGWQCRKDDAQCIRQPI
jgi:hypothetical protein